MNIPMIDLVFTVIIVVFAILGLVKGFVNVVFSWAAPILSIWAGMLFYRNGAVILKKYVSSESAALLFSFLLIFVITFVLVKIAQLMAGNIFKGLLFSQLNHFLGFVIGIVEGLAITILILIVLAVQPWFDVTELLMNSLFFHLFHGIISIPAESVSSALVDLTRKVGI